MERREVWGSGGGGGGASQMGDSWRSGSSVLEEGNRHDKGGCVVKEQPSMGAVEEGAKRKVGRRWVGGVETVMEAGTKEGGGGSRSMSRRGICKDEKFTGNILEKDKGKRLDGKATKRGREEQEMLGVMRSKTKMFC